MRIRTRYTLFKVIIGLGVLVFLVSLWDMFANDSAFKTPILVAYVALIALGLILYIGYKPDLGAEPEPVPPAPESGVPMVEAAAAAPSVEEEVVELEEVPKRRATVTGANVQGPHAFRCPFCSQVFGLEATHLDRTNDFRMNCPYCANSIRVPRAPKVAAGNLSRVKGASVEDRVLYACTACGEVLRFTAPGSRLERALSVSTCPNCRSPSLSLAAA